MKKNNIREIREREERRKIEFKKRMEYEIHKRGITKRKEDYEEQRMRKYVRNLNEMYSIINPEKHIEITEGTKKEGKKHCSTRSVWEKNHEEEENISNFLHKKYLEEKKREEKIDTKTKKPKKIMIIMGEKVYTTDARIEIVGKKFTTKIKFGKKCTDVLLEEYTPEKNKMYSTKYGEMSGEMLEDVSEKTGVRIYEAEVITVEEDEEEEW